MKKHIITVCAVLFFSLFTTALQAQVLRELRNRTIERTIDKVVDRTADKLAEKMATAIMQMLEPNFEAWMQGTGNSFDPALLPETYHFHYKYRLQIASREGTVEMEYYLNKNNPGYLGVHFNAGAEMFMVMDNNLKANITYLNTGDTPLAMAMEAKDLGADEQEPIDNLEGYTFSELPDKEFLGYTCKGRLIENEDHAFIIYIAPNMPANLGNGITPGTGEQPPVLASAVSEFENGLMMLLEITDKKNQRRQNLSGTMECIGFEAFDYSISNSDYSFR
ncbi:MAG: hypothetical protein K0B37_16575 [Bacteroidales bacterium]|nr:hypothetical protein [Bacteroidales bacterium]